MTWLEVWSSPPDGLGARALKSFCPSRQRVCASLRVKGSLAPGFARH